jgi:hypothetical protein
VFLFLSNLIPFKFFFCYKMAMRSSALPLLVSDIGISEAMTINNDGDTALRVEGGASAWTSAQAVQVTDTVGDVHLTQDNFPIIECVDRLRKSTGQTSDSSSTPTIIGLLKSIAAKLE